MVSVKKLVNPSSDVVTRGLKLNGVVWLGGVKFSAVAAVSADGSLGKLIELEESFFALSSPLPRIFVSICEVSIRSLNVEASLIGG